MSFHATFAHEIRRSLTNIYTCGVLWCSGWHTRFRIQWSWVQITNTIIYQIIVHQPSASGNYCCSAHVLDTTYSVASCGPLSYS